MVKVTFLDVKTAFSDLGGEAAVLLCGENGFEQTSCYKKLNELSGDALARAVKMQEFTGEKGASLFLLAPAAQLGAALLVGVGGKDKKDPSDLEMEEAGGAAFTALKKHFGKKIPKKVLFVLPGPFAGKAARAALGVELASYFFNRHKGTGAKTEERNPVAPEWVFALPGAEDAEKAGQAWKNLAGLGQGVKLARDLVSEPANHLFPAEFVKRIEALRGQGLDVEVLDCAAMKKLGFGALLGVAQGSEQPPYAVVMRYRGAEGAPLAFVGKGVTFDSGGISIKPSAGMDEMKTDMGGAAAVTGLMSALAAQKMPVNAVGIVGLVENMPSGTAQRPGDIVTSYSGQTIEVLNTDAEGRLVLADLLSYIVKQENPRAVIDLATLTGAILIALGDKYAGLFSNEDTLAEALQKAGQETGEKLWRLPLGEEYDRMLDSPVADIKNISEGRLAGSITAAQFLRRFVGETPWAHLDIAGVAYKGKGTDLAPRGATGFGVRLLNDFVQNFR